MDEEFVTLVFEAHDVSLLVFVKILREDISTLSVGLTPLLSLCIKKLEAKDTLSKLTHDVNPKHGVDFISLKSKKSVDFRKLAQKVSAGVGSALLETC